MERIAEVDLLENMDIDLPEENSEEGLSNKEEDLGPSIDEKASVEEKPLTDQQEKDPILDDSQKKGRYQKRIDSLTKKNKDYERRLEALERKNLDLEQNTKNQIREESIVKIEREKLIALDEGRHKDYIALDGEMRKIETGNGTSSTTQAWELQDSINYFKTKFDWYDPENKNKMTTYAHGLNSEVFDVDNSSCKFMTHKEKLDYIGEQVEKEFAGNPYKNSHSSEGITTSRSNNASASKRNTPERRASISKMYGVRTKKEIDDLIKNLDNYDNNNEEVSLY